MTDKIASIKKTVSFEDLSPKAQQVLDEFRNHIKSHVEAGTGEFCFEGDLYFTYAISNSREFLIPIDGVCYGYLIANGCSPEEAQIAYDFAWSKNMWVKYISMNSKNCQWTKCEFIG